MPITHDTSDVNFEVREAAWAPGAEPRASRASRLLSITALAFAIASLVFALAGCASARLAAIRAARKAIDEARENLADPEKRAALAEKGLESLDKADAKLAGLEKEEEESVLVDPDAPESQAAAAAD